MIALATTSIAWILVVVLGIGYAVYAFLNIRASRDELGSEVELAPNRKPFHDDETLENERLTWVLGTGVVLLVIIVVALPLYWILEPARQEGAVAAKEEQFIEWGADLFAPTADGGFNCAGCHGGMNAPGGSAEYNITDPSTGAVEVVNWKAPALDTVLYRFDESELEYILVYGRPFSPMSPWGTEGGGPLNDQQIDTLIAYIESIQIPREDCGVGETDAKTCESGHLPTEIQQEIAAAANKAVEDGDADSLGEALFNLELASGAYSCARCHTPGWSYDQPGVGAQGAMGWNLRGGAVNAHFTDENAVIEFIKTGSEDGARYGLQGQGSGRMPGFGAMLTDEQIQHIVEYVRSL